MPDYTGRDGIPDIRARLLNNEELDGQQNERLDALEANGGSQGPAGPQGPQGADGIDGTTPHIERGTIALDGNGRATLTFAVPFGAAPIVVATGVDDNGKSINVQIDRLNTQGGQWVSVRIQGDRVEEMTPSLLTSLLGWRVRRRDDITGVTVHVLAIEA